LPFSPKRTTWCTIIVNLVVYLKSSTLIALVRAADTRRTETPNATMTTHASPTLGASSGLSLWQVEMAADARGPRHVFDSEQLWTVLEGKVCIDIDGDTTDLAEGDTIVLPAGVERQIAASTAARLLVCGHGNAVVRVPGEDAPRGTPPWIA
jgi:quercetin dioxygenase-like cupin family protein